DLQRGIPPFEPSRRDHPPWLRQHHDMEGVWDFNNVQSLPLNRQRWFGDHSLKPTNTAFVPTPISFIHNEQDAVLEMAMELVDDMRSGGYLEGVRAEYSLKTSDQGPLARALLADQHQRDFCLRGWVLD